MKCSYCGAETDPRKVYCLVCGRKLTPERENLQKYASVTLKQHIPQETVDPVTPKEEKEYPRTHAVLEELFGPEADWAVPPRNPQPETEMEEDYEFPVTPCNDWQDEDEMDMEDSLPVYTTAPLRQDVEPARISLPKDPEDFDEPDESEITEEPEPIAEGTLKLPVGRSITKMVLFGLLTLGIYPTVIWSRIVTELNIAASRNDNKITMPYLGMLLLAPVTLGVFPFVWMHRFCNRVRKQLVLRNCAFRFSSKDFWLWGVLGCLILVGPFIFTHKVITAMNLINMHYNEFDR